MKLKRKTMKFVSGMLTAITLVTNALSPVIAYAAPTDEADSRIPYYEEIKDQLDQDEVVTARDIEVTVGSEFDVKADFSGIKIPDSEKAKVKLMEAQNDEGKEFSTDHADTYKTVYSVEPQKTDHPVYQISRNITVKDVSKEADTTVNSDSSSDQDSGTGETEESEDSDDESETDEVVNVPETETETEVTGEEITEEEFDAEIESTENQETVDPETGTTLSEVLEEAVDQGIALDELKAGETVTFEMPMRLAASTETGTQSVSITAGSWYYYSDYGLGSYLTCPYYVKWGSITATAYCVQPSKRGPDDGTYSITKLSDSKTLAKVCYYGTKASDENGFFDEKHPDFSAGKRFIITHIAAAYANGSSDWDSGTNATGRSLAMELYNYCINMPDIPDVDMSFSDNDVKAYVEGNIQRTKTITFKADELQTITFKLPAGVKLVNVTTGKTSAAGASVEICGGTQFYLTAPLSQAEDVSASFSSKMKGSIDKEYSAYKITTGSSTQDLALVFGEGVGNEKYVDFKVTWTKECYVSIVKKDSETSNALAGAVYGIYSDAACTQLIKQIPATDASGASKVTIEKTQEVVYLKEISVPTGYTIDAKAYNVTLNIGKTTNMNVIDKRVTATISLHKQDAETGNTPQGDATLEGAVYGLFAREDIVHPDGKTGILYKKGTQITSLTTDKNGQSSVSNLYLGKYYLKELTPPVGYLLDQEEHEVDCSYEGANVPVVERKAISKEDVIKQPFQIIKAANNGKTDADLLKGIGFSAWLASDLKVKEDGSYDFSSANPVVITADGKTEMFTDEKGYACSIPLPYGTYVVKETTSKHNYEPVDDFIVTINENHPDTPQVWRVLLDKEFEAKLKIIKKDDETKKSVLLANTEFKVYDLDHQKYVEQVTTYPSTKVHKSYFTDENGYLILPNNLEIGNYRIEEVTAPEGYTQSSAYVNVSVDTNTAYMIDPTSKDAIIEVEYENHPVKGELKIFKQGELLTGYDKDFQYELCGLKGVTFEVYAAEDIFTADHQVDENGNRTLYYAKDALVAEVTTDDEGFAYVKNLPLGEYYVKESAAPDGFVHNDHSEKAVFVYADQSTPVVYDQVSFTNERQKVSITVEKQDADNGNVVSGAVFGIYNIEDIINKDGDVIVKADTLLQEMTSDDEGQANCTLDLPLGKYSETFISLAVISWTYLLHTYYANNGVDYRYYKKKGSRKYYDRTKHGAYKHWELERCLDDKNSPIDSETTNNLKFLIGIRHEIEHQMTNKIDESISAKLQACSINYNYYIKKLFGNEYGVDNQLGFAIQFSPVTPEQKKDLLNNNKLANNVKNFISEFEEKLTEEDVRSPKYAYRLLFTPLNANRKGQADQVIEFVKSGTEGSEQLNKAYAVIKETEKKKYRAKEVVQIMHDKGYTWFNTSMMTDYWKNTLGSRESYGVLLSNNQWFWYDNWIPVIEAYCKKRNPTIKPESVKNGYYASEIVAQMVQLGYENFTTNSFVKFWRDHMHIDKNNTKYGYTMPNQRYVWTEEFLQLVKKYCEDNKSLFMEKDKI